MSGFRVIKEQTHKYKKDTLYVLIFRDGSSFGVDVTNSVAGFGRIKVDTKEQAEYVFERINDLIIETNDYLRSCELCSSALKGIDFADIVLFLHTNRRLIDKGEVYSLIYMLGLMKTEKALSNGGHMVSVKRVADEEILGQFILVRDEGKYMFHYF